MSRSGAGVEVRGPVGRQRRVLAAAVAERVV